MNAQIQARRALERELREALNAGALELFYQPLLNLQENRINACEALLRWRHPERGFISPASSSRSPRDRADTPIGEWVLREACREAATWPGEIKVAVNLSPVQFSSTEPRPSRGVALRTRGSIPSAWNWRSPSRCSSPTATPTSRSYTGCAIWVCASPWTTSGPGTRR